MSASPLMRLLIVTAESLDVARGSGTAMAIRRLRDALARVGVSAPAMIVHRARARSGPRDYDAVLGVDGVGAELADVLDVPFIAPVKAFYRGVVAHEHGVAKVRVRRRARRECDGARRADAVIVPSPFAAEAVARRYGVARERIDVIPEPFDADAWAAALPRRPRTGTRVLCVAHLYPRKRVIDLVRAWPLVRMSLPGARLDIAGGGPELRHLARATAGLAGCFMHGHVGHPAILELYARADCFCLPSAQETYGYAAIEAMASGLPLVVASAGALPELCEGAVCESVAPGDVAALAATVIRALDPARRADAARVNPERARQGEPAAVATRYLAVVDAATARHRAGGSESRSASLRR